MGRRPLPDEGEVRGGFLGNRPPWQPDRTRELNGLAREAGLAENEASGVYTGMADATIVDQRLRHGYRSDPTRSGERLPECAMRSCGRSGSERGRQDPQRMRRD